MLRVHRVEERKSERERVWPSIAIVIVVKIIDEDVDRVLTSSTASRVGGSMGAHLGVEKMTEKK